MNLKTLNMVVRAALPSMMTLGTQVMLGTLEVKGEATLASASDRDMPAWAAFRAWGPEALHHWSHDPYTYPTIIGSISTHTNSIPEGGGVM